LFSEISSHGAKSNKSKLISLGASVYFTYGRPKQRQTP